ncbi:sugar phosphate isomerase/epimerase, partial [Blautia producta]
MKTGVFTVSMPEYSPKEAVRILKELGYDGVEWRVAPLPDKKKEN